MTKKQTLYYLDVIKKEGMEPNKEEKLEAINRAVKSLINENRVRKAFEILKAVCPEE